MANSDDTGQPEHPRPSRAPCAGEAAAKSNVVAFPGCVPPEHMIERDVAGELLSADGRLVDDMGFVRDFLCDARPMDGCDVDDDDRFLLGRDLLAAWLERSLRGREGHAPELVTREQLLFECAAVLHYLDGLEPVHRKPETSDERADCASCGCSLVHRWIENKLIRISRLASRDGDTLAARLRTEVQLSH
jgi:hypothetical protein